MKIFNLLIRRVMLIYIAFIVLCSFGYGIFFNTSINIIPIIILAGLFILIFLFRKKLKIDCFIAFIKNLDLKYILLIALFLRLIWVLLIPTKPFSDFAVMYNYAKDAAAGKYYGFYGIGYFARFAHDSITVLYFSLFYHITSDPLIIVKLLNVVLQTLAVYYIYKLVLELFKDKSRANYSALLLAMFPPFVLFVSQTMSENMAMPFYIAAVFYFFKGLHAKGKSSIYYYVLCGIILSVANMFRMVGVVVLIAFAVYLLFYEGYKKFLTRYPIIVISFCFLFFIVSQSLVSAGVLETQLWNSKEPAITSVLKGTNIQYNGAYNDEDASLPIKLNYDSAAIKKAATEIIKKRITTTPPIKLASFYVSKIALQWGCSDYGAVNWTITPTDNSNVANFLRKNMLIVYAYISLVYIFILIKAIISLLSAEKHYFKEMYFFYILLLGFVLFCLITEMQPRYGFIAAWIFVVLGVKTKTTNEI